MQLRGRITQKMPDTNGPARNHNEIIMVGGKHPMTPEILWLAINGKLPCLFREMTGLYCPGCGGTRAVKALLRGDIVTSFLYHPLVLYCALVAAVFAVSYICYWKTRNPRFRLYLENGYVYAGLAILAVNFIVKNYCLLVKGIDILTILSEI